MDFNSEDYLTTKDACRFLSKSYTSLRRYIAQGKIKPPHKVNQKTCYYEKADLINFIRNSASSEDYEIVEEKKRVDHLRSKLFTALNENKAYRKMDAHLLAIEKARIVLYEQMSDILDQRIRLIKI